MSFPRRGHCVATYCQCPAVRAPPDGISSPIMSCADCSHPYYAHIDLDSRELYTVPLRQCGGFVRNPTNHDRCACGEAFEQHQLTLRSNPALVSSVSNSSSSGVLNRPATSYDAPCTPHRPHHIAGPPLAPFATGPHISPFAHGPSLPTFGSLPQATSTPSRVAHSSLSHSPYLASPSLSRTARVPENTLPQPPLWTNANMELWSQVPSYLGPQSNDPDIPLPERRRISAEARREPTASRASRRRARPSGASAAAEPKVYEFWVALMPHICQHCHILETTLPRHKVIPHPWPIDISTDHVAQLCERLEQANLLIPVRFPYTRKNDNCFPFIHAAILDHFRNHPDLCPHQPFHPDSTTATPSNSGWCVQKLRKRKGAPAFLHAQANPGLNTLLTYFQTNKFLGLAGYVRHLGDPDTARKVVIIAPSAGPITGPIYNLYQADFGSRSMSPNKLLLRHDCFADRVLIDLPFTTMITHNTHSLQKCRGEIQDASFCCPKSPFSSTPQEVVVPVTAPPPPASQNQHNDPEGPQVDVVIPTATPSCAAPQSAPQNDRFEDVAPIPPVPRPAYLNDLWTPTSPLTFEHYHMQYMDSRSRSGMALTSTLIKGPDLPRLTTGLLEFFQHVYLTRNNLSLTQSFIPSHPAIFFGNARNLDLNGLLNAKVECESIGDGVRTALLHQSILHILDSPLYESLPNGSPFVTPVFPPPFPLDDEARAQWFSHGMLFALHLIVLGQPTNLSPFILLALAASSPGDSLSLFFDELTGPLIAALDPKVEEHLRPWLILAPEDPIAPPGTSFQLAPAAYFLMNQIEFLSPGAHVNYRVPRDPMLHTAYSRLIFEHVLLKCSNVMTNEAFQLMRSGFQDCFSAPAEVHIAQHMRSLCGGVPDYLWLLYHRRIQDPSSVIALIQVQAADTLRTRLRDVPNGMEKFDLFRTTFRGLIVDFLNESVDNCAMLMEAMTASPALSLGAKPLTFIIGPPSPNGASMTLSFHTCFSTADLMYDKWARRAVVLHVFGELQQTFSQWFGDQISAAIAGCFNTA